MIGRRGAPPLRRMLVGPDVAVHRGPIAQPVGQYRDHLGVARAGTRGGDHVRIVDRLPLLVQTTERAGRKGIQDTVTHCGRETHRSPVRSAGDVIPRTRGDHERGDRGAHQHQRTAPATAHDIDDIPVLVG